MDNLILNPNKALKLILATACMISAVCIPVKKVSAQSKNETKVTFQKDRFNRIFIPAKIDGDTVPILLGTYSKTLRLTPYFMQTRELYPSWNGLGLTDKRGRRQSRMIFYLPKMEIGTIKFRHEETVVNYAFPDSVATGATGTLMVYQYNWRIDNDRNEVSISKSPFTPAQPFAAISYKNNSYPTASVDIEGTKAPFAVDLGSGTTFQVSSGSALGQQLISRYKLTPKNTLVSTIHGRKLVDTVYEVIVPSLALNGTALTNQKVILSSAAPHNSIGTGFLGNYNVIMNNSKKRKIESTLILEKRLVN
jgi:hypothetical protein